MNTEQHLSDNWYRLTQLVDTVIGGGTSSKEERENHELAQKYRMLLDYVRHDRATQSGTFVLGLYRAPASKDRHHDREGGLVQHLFEMWQWWHIIRNTLEQGFRLPHPSLNDRDALRAIIHHDLNKVWRYRYVPNKCTCGEIMNAPANHTIGDIRPCPVHAGPGEWNVEYASTIEDRLDAMLGSVNKSLWIIGRHGIPMSPLLHNALITSEGGYSALRNKLPDTDTVFAKIMYLLDELSANVLDRLSHGRFWDSKRGGMSDESQTRQDGE